MPCLRARSTTARSRTKPRCAKSEKKPECSADLVGKLADIKYFYVRNWGDHARVFKIVSFYLLLYRSGRLGQIAPEMRIEVQRAFWLPLDDAPTKLIYRGEREVVQRAQEYVKAHPELGDHATDTAH